MRLMLIFVLILCACSTVPFDAYEKLQIGTSKETLLDEVGSPIKTKHADDKDIWTYKFYVNDDEIYRDIYIQNNKVTFKGETKHALETKIEEKVQESLKHPLPEPPLKQDEKPIEHFVPVE